MFGKPARLWRRLKDDRSGVAAIEFALSLPLLMVFVTAILEFGMILFVDTLMEGGLRQASRYGITGQEIDGTNRVDAIKAIVGQHTLGFVDMGAATIQILVYPGFGDIGQPEDFTDSNGNGSWDAGEAFTDTNGNGSWDQDQGAEGAGGAGDVVVYRLSYDWTLMTPFAEYLVGNDGVLKLSASLVVRNEPWEDS